MTDDEAIEFERLKTARDSLLLKVANLRGQLETIAAKEREVVANWIMNKGFATGHGDSIVDLLDQLEWQIEEKEREACAKACEEVGVWPSLRPKDCAEAIRERGQA